jgi:hypothetical protein
MKTISVGEGFAKDLKAFLYTTNTSQEKHKVGLKIKRPDLLMPGVYEYTTKQVSPKYDSEIKTINKLSFYPLFDPIDAYSKETVISELHPTDMVVFLGDSNKVLDEIKSSLTRQGISSIVKSTESSYITKIKDNTIKVKYDYALINKLPCVMVKDYGYIYSLRDSLLKVKRKRGKIDEIIITDKSSKPNCMKIADDKQTDTLFYSSGDLKLIAIKRNLSRLLNDKFNIADGVITNQSGDFKLYIRDGELVLEGTFSPTYLKIRNFVYSNYINIEE